jgi:hypothetical protein
MVRDGRKAQSHFHRGPLRGRVEGQSVGAPSKNGVRSLALRVDDVAPHGYAIDRANVRQRKTGRPVRFELTEQTRESLDAYLRSSGRQPGQVLFRVEAAQIDL